MLGNKKKLLITGINGFLGSHLAKNLCKSYEIIGLEYQKRNLFRLKGLNLKVYESKNNFKKIFEDNDIFAIIHAATIYRKKNESINKLIETNILLPAKLFELANNFKTTVFINTDTFFNQSNSKYAYLTDYTLSKKHALDWLKAIRGKCKLINMKLFHMYGPFDAPDKFVPYIISSLKKNLSSIDLTLGEQKRDFVHIDDVVNAYKLVLDKNEKLEENYYEFEVGLGESISIKDFIKLIKNISSSSTKLNFGSISYRENEIMDSKANNHSLKAIGWKPAIDIRTGIEKLIEDK